MSSMESGRYGSDWALVVQGVLIFLSSCVAVAGYWVQGKVRAKERLREEEDKKMQLVRQIYLKRIQEKMTLLVGPCCQYGFNLVTHLGYLKDYIKKQYPAEYEKHQTELAKKGETMKHMYQGKWNKTWSVAGAEIEEIMQNDPSGAFAKVYRQSIRSIIYEYAVPMADLINRYAQSHSMRGTAEQYKIDFPDAAGNGLLRNLYPCQFVRWTCEFRLIIEREWDKGVYDRYYTTVNPYPSQIVRHFVKQITKIREIENEYGIDVHAMQTQDAITKQQAEQVAMAKKEKEKAKYVVASAAVGAGVAGTILQITTGTE